MRRLPVYFVVDVSDSMVGKPLELLTDQLEKLMRELSADPYALETAFISMIVFAGKVKKLISMQEVYKVTLPTLHVGSGTSFGQAIDFLINDIKTNIKSGTAERKGDWKPLIFFFTDGAPTDDYQIPLIKWQQELGSKTTTVAIGLGNNADLEILKKITRNVIKLSPSDEIGFKKFFQWVSKSVQVSSRRIEPQESLFSDLILSDKKTGEEQPQVDNRYVILKAQCSIKHQGYLLKFAGENEDLEGAYPIDLREYDELSSHSGATNSYDTRNLKNIPSCPICSNPYSLVLCSICGNLHCATEGQVTCPWCGNRGTLTFVDSLSVKRTLG